MGAFQPPASNGIEHLGGTRDFSRVSKAGMKMKSICVSFVVPESGNLLVTSGVITFGTVRPGALGGQ